MFVMVFVVETIRFFFVMVLLFFFSGVINEQSILCPWLKLWDLKGIAETGDIVHFHS